MVLMDEEDERDGGMVWGVASRGRSPGRRCVGLSGAGGRHMVDSGARVRANLTMVLVTCMGFGS